MSTVRCLMVLGWVGALSVVCLIVSDFPVYGSQLRTGNSWLYEDRDPLSSTVRGEEAEFPFSVMGQKITLWRGWYANGKQRYVHTYLHGQPQGLHTDWNDQGQKIQEQTWHRGAVQGRSIRWYANG